MTTVFCSREERLAREFIERFELDLQGLTVLTEAASGPYLYSPLVAGLAGADKVFAVTGESCYSSKEATRMQTLRAAEQLRIDDRVEVSFEKPESWIAKSDIITNTGFVRPITSEMIGQMKATAVISLMWETWEFRERDIDLEACRAKGILVLGTCESRPPCDMTVYSGAFGMKLLFELGLEGYGCRVLLLGGQRILADAIRQALINSGVVVTQFNANDATEGGSYEDLDAHFAAHGAEYDALIVAEHQDPRLLVGEGGVLEFARLTTVNPTIRIGVIAGNVDAEGLRKSGVPYYPPQIRPFGEMSYQPYALGPRPVLELYTAGLKVGQAMSRARLAGASLADATREALQCAPAMDFSGDQA